MNDQAIIFVPTTLLAVLCLSQNLISYADFVVTMIVLFLLTIFQEQINDLLYI